MVRILVYFHGEKFYSAQTPTHSTTLDHLLACAYSVYSQLPSTSRNCLHLQLEDIPIHLCTRWFIFEPPCTIKLEGKVVLLQVMKVCGGVEVYLHALTLALVWFTSHPTHFTLRGKKPQYPLNKKLGQPETFCSEKRNLLPMPEIEPWFLRCPACSPISVSPMLSWLPYTQLTYVTNVSSTLIYFWLKVNWFSGDNTNLWQFCICNRFSGKWNFGFTHHFSWEDTGIIQGHDKCGTSWLGVTRELDNGAVILKDYFKKQSVSKNSTPSTVTLTSNIHPK